MKQHVLNDTVPLNMSKISESLKNNPLGSHVLIHFVSNYYLTTCKYVNIARLNSYFYGLMLCTDIWLCLCNIMWQWRTTPSYNIFWSEKNHLAKLAHMLIQMFVFPLLPFVVLAATVFSKCCESCTPCGWLIRQSQVR